jgi:hypothetical protein
MTAFDGTYAGVSRTFEGEINAVTRGAGSIPPRLRAERPAGAASDRRRRGAV